MESPNETKTRFPVGWYRMPNGLPACVTCVHKDGVVSGHLLLFEPESTPMLAWRPTNWTETGRHDTNINFDLKRPWEGALRIPLLMDFPKGSPTKPTDPDFSFSANLPEGCRPLGNAPSERLRAGDLVLTAIGTWTPAPGVLYGLDRKDVRSHGFLAACRPSTDEAQRAATPPVDLSTACPGLWKDRDGDLVCIEGRSLLPGCAFPYFGRRWLKGAEQWAARPKSWNEKGVANAHGLECDLVSPWTGDLPQGCEHPFGEAVKCAEAPLAGYGMGGPEGPGNGPLGVSAVLDPRSVTEAAVESDAMVDADAGFVKRSAEDAAVAKLIASQTSYPDGPERRVSLSPEEIDQRKGCTLFKPTSGEVGQVCIGRIFGSHPLPNGQTGVLVESADDPNSLRVYPGDDLAAARVMVDGSLNGSGLFLPFWRTEEPTKHPAYANQSNPDERPDVVLERPQPRDGSFVLRPRNHDINKTTPGPGRD